MEMGMRPGMLGGEMVNAQPIGEREVEAATEILQKYKQGKANLEGRIVSNEQWYKLRQWEEMRRSGNKGDPEPASAWLLNSIANKHADAMDNYPSASVLPREQGDQPDAKVLSDILPVVFERNNYEQTYSDMWWYKLKSGTGVYGVFWDSGKDGGVGDIAIKQIDLLNLFWEPGVIDIQASQNIFYVQMVSNDALGGEYPELAGTLATPTIDIAKYIHDDTIDLTDKSAVVDWYYKLRVGGRDVLHYCKYVNNYVMYATENDPAYAQRGLYDHGQYPFVFDVLFHEAGMPTGFGYVDVCRDPQEYIDRLDQTILKNAMALSRPRYFIRDDGAINEAEYADWSKEFVHYSGTVNPKENIMQIDVKPLDAIYLNVLSNKIDELKETSGNRDFSQGSTTSGVTAASAIAALQEAGSKLSRDMIKSSYRAHTQVAYLVLENIRQFYDEPRSFRIIGEQGAMAFVEYDNARIKARQQGGDFGVETGVREPIFDIQVRAHKSNAFSTIAQNELAKEFYGMGFFNPQLSDQALACIEMMDFEGKDAVTQRIAQNGTLYERVMQLEQALIEMTAMIDPARAQVLAQGLGAQGGAGQAATGGRPSVGTIDTNSLGRAVSTSRQTTANTARERAVSAAAPK